MIHLVTLNPALDLSLDLQEPKSGKIGKLLDSGMEAGGKAINVARFLNKWKTPAVTWLGTGGGSHPTHVLYRSLLDKEGLTASFLSSQAPIRINAVASNLKSSRKYNHPGSKLPSGVFFKLLPAISRKDTVLLTGRLPGGMRDSTYADWIGVFNKRGIRTILDTSGKALALGLKANPWFFKVNLFEFSEACGKKFNSLARVFKVLPIFRKHGLSHGSVTDGANGAVVWKDEGTVWVKSSQRSWSKLVVGAGDAFLAGYLKGLESRKNLLECAKLACAAGTVVALKGIKGFEPKIVDAEMKNIKTTKITSV